MIVPIGDAPNLPARPYVTYLLIAANIVVYALVALPLGAAAPAPNDPLLLEYVRVMAHAVGNQPEALSQLLSHVSAYDLFVFAHGFRPAAPALSALFVSMFLHGGLLHLIGNMLFLWIYGDNVEHRLGRLRYLLAYLGTGAFATLFHYAWNPTSEMPMIGASGAISGVLGFYFVWFPHNHVRLLWLLPPFFMDVFELPARLVLGFYLVAENLLPFLLVRSGTGVAYGAHIGGFIGGFGTAWLLGAFPRRGVPRPPGVEAAMRLADEFRAAGRPHAALATLQRGLRNFPRHPQLADVHAQAGAILLEDMGQPVAAYQHFLDSLDLDPDGPAAAAAHRGLKTIESHTRGLR